VQTRQKTKKQHGQATIELMASLVFFCLMLVAFSSISAYIYVEHGLVSSVREGARWASLNNDLAGDDEAGAITAIKTRVITMMRATTGQVLPAQAITVTPPSATGAFGERTVTVRVNTNIATPFNIGAMLNGLNAATLPPLTVPIAAATTMRYEE
jgi:Flp pilus assembly protein TadG